MLDFMTITKALSDENRVRVLMALTHGEMCVCQITELLGLAPSTVSKHMSILRQSQLVDHRKDGRWAYYRLGEDADNTMVQEAIAWVSKHLAADKVVVEDREHLKQVLCADQEELCRKQRCCG